MDVKIKVIDSNNHQVYLGFTLKVIPRIGEIIQNNNGKQFEVLNILHRKHDISNDHVIEIFISEALK